MTAPTPEPAARVLSEAERRVLADMAGHENAGDPGFVLRMNAPIARAVPDDDEHRGPVEQAVARGRRRDRTIQAVVLGAIVALVLPLAWTVALLLTAVLVVVPTVLVVKALRDGGLEPPARDDESRPPGA